MEQRLLEEAGDPDRSDLLDHRTPVAVSLFDNAPGLAAQGEFRGVRFPVLQKGDHESLTGRVILTAEEIDVGQMAKESWQLARCDKHGKDPAVHSERVGG